MFSALWLQFKGYLFAAGGVVVAIFLAMFQYQRSSIKALKTDNETLKGNSDKLDTVIAKKEKELKTRAKVNEILSQPRDIDATLERLRKRRESRDSQGE